MTALDPRLWLGFVLALLLSIGLAYHKGGRDMRAEFAARQARAVAAAREAEGEIQRLNNRAIAAYIGRLNQQLEKAHALPKIALADDCAVPADVGRVLDDAQRLPGDAGTGSGAGAAGAPADSTCAAELDIAKRNYAEVCLPNAAQLTELQARWEQTRAIVNQGRK